MLKSSTSIILEVLNIEDDGSHLLMKTKINGKVAKLLIDTGASRTVLDESRIRDYVDRNDVKKHDKLSTGLGTSNMPTSTIILKTFRLGDLVLKNFPVVLLDLQHVNGSYEKMGYPAIDGVLGNDILLNYKAEISFKKLQLTLYKK